MTNIKRALSLVLVLALALSMVVMGTSAASFTDVKTDYAYSTEVQFLADLQVVNGYSDGSYKPEGIVTRAEAAAVIYRMLSSKNSAGNYQGDTKFADVTSSHWASGYVNFCVELGVVAGYPDGKFYPDQTLTYAEYTTMLVRALGLDQGKDPAYPFGYIALASVEGVNADVDLSASDACNRGAVAKLTYNSILDATYARIANSIYVTEKPTIAKNVLKLETVEGVLTSTGDYDFAGASSVGEGKVRIANVTGSSNTSNYAVGSSFQGDFDVPASSLGYKTKIWYKPDTASASGSKVYAVILKNAKVFNNSQVGLKMPTSTTKMIYDAGTEEKTIDLDSNCIFIENNEYVGNATTTSNITFYGMRAWLPYAYKFIDNDEDGDYDYVIRTRYGFAKVANMTSSEIQISGQVAVDRKDSAGNAYDWDAMLTDIAVDDYVMYYTDGALATTTTANLFVKPSFSTSLYDDTNNATFTKISKETNSLQSIVDGDKFIFDGKTYRAMSGIGENPDLLSSSELGKEYDYYALSAFGIIAKSELLSPSSGKYIVVTGVGTPKFGAIDGEFDIQAKDENDDTVVYSVKANASSGLTTYNPAAKTTATGGLTSASVTVGGFYEYTLDSNGKISTLKQFTTPAATIAAGDAGYNNTSKLVVASNLSYLVQDSTIVFVKAINAATAAVSYKVYTAGFPKIGSLDALGNASVTNVFSASYKTSSGTNKLNAMYIDTTAATLSGSSSTTGVTGYLRAAAVENNDTEWSYKYTIAYDGEASKVFYSKTAGSHSDLAAVLTDENLPANDVNLGSVVTFDINNDGTISNMSQKKKIANTTVTTDGKYYGTSKVKEVDTSNRILTVTQLSGTAVTAGARLTNIYDPSSASEATIIGTTAPVLGTTVVEGSTVSYRYAEDVNVYVFDYKTTFQAGVSVESIGSVQKSTSTDMYLVSFGYDDDDYVITDIFFNKYPFVTTTTTTPTTPTGTVANATVSYVEAVATPTYVLIGNTQYALTGSAQEFFKNGVITAGKKISFETTTTGAIYKITAIDGNVTLNAAQSAFDGLTVNGNLTLDGANSYIATNVTVNGNLVVGTGAATNLTATHFTVTGTTTVNSTGVVTFNSNLNGNVTVTGAGAGSKFENVTFGANVSNAFAGLLIKNSTIAGNFTATAATTFDGTVTVAGTYTGSANITVAPTATTTTTTNVTNGANTETATAALASVTLTNTAATAGQVRIAGTAVTMEYSLNAGTTWITASAGNTDVTAAIGSSIKVRVIATPNAYTKSFTVALANITPVTMAGATISAATDIITGLTTGTVYEVFIGADYVTFTADADGEIKPAAHGQDYAAAANVNIRIKATANTPASTVQTIVVVA